MTAGLHDDGNCVMSDLPPAQCSHCRKLDEPAPKAHIFGPPVATEHIQWGAFPARYRGWCDECDSVISVGQGIAYTTSFEHRNSDGKQSVVHQDCR